MKIPILSTPDKPITSTTQNFLPFANIVDDIVLFKDGGAAIVMESTSLNFDLLSEKEQQSVIIAYAALLNSLSFPIQIMIKTQKKDISVYIEYLDKKQIEISNPKLIAIMQDYKNFILESVKKKNVLGKRFFIVIPFSALELGVTKSFLSVTKRKGPLPFPKSYVVKKAKMTLYPKRDHLIKQAGRLGLSVKQITSSELANLYFDIYNTETTNIVAERDGKNKAIDDK